MSGIAEPSGQRRAAQSLNRFHVATIAWQGQGWRIPFSAPLFQPRFLPLGGVAVAAARKGGGKKGEKW